jgi:hypothetical protein
MLDFSIDELHVEKEHDDHGKPLEPHTSIDMFHSQF